MIARYFSIMFAMTYCILASGAEAAEEINAERLIAAYKEVATRNLSNDSEKFRNLCDREEDEAWCEGYISAVIAHLESTEASTCIPVTDVGRFDFDGVWTLIKAWLYRQSATQQVTFLMPFPQHSQRMKNATFRYGT